MVNIGNTNKDAARWWAAILAPGEGWEAYITIREDKFRLPWSISLPAKPIFSLLYPTNNFSLLDTAMSAEIAFYFLHNYCALHNIIDQGFAVLLAVLLLPLLHSSRKDILLPRLIFNRE